MSVDKKGKRKAGEPYRRKGGVEEKNDESPDGDTIKKTSSRLTTRGMQVHKGQFYTDFIMYLTLRVDGNKSNRQCYWHCGQVPLFCQPTRVRPLSIPES